MGPSTRVAKCRSCPAHWEVCPEDPLSGLTSTGCRSTIRDPALRFRSASTIYCNDLLQRLANDGGQRGKLRQLVCPDAGNGRRGHRSQSDRFIATYAGTRRGPLTRPVRSGPPARIPWGTTRWLSRGRTHVRRRRANSRSEVLRKWPIGRGGPSRGREVWPFGGVGRSSPRRESLRAAGSSTAVTF